MIPHPPPTARTDDLGGSSRGGAGGGGFLFGASHGGGGAAIPVRPLTSTAADRAGMPLMTVDGRPLDLGGADWHMADARMTKQFALMQEANLAELEKLNARLRKEYDAAKMANKRRQKELQQVTSELTTIERVVSGTDRSSGPLAAVLATIADYEAKIAAAQEQLQAAEHNAHMYEFMADRLREETKDMNLDIGRLSKALTVATAAHQEAALTLHQASSQKTRAVALVHTLSRHLEAGRAQRRVKMARVDIEVAEQRARLRAYDEREQRRTNMSMMSRGDLDEDGEDRLKQLFLVRKIYNNMLSRRLRDDQRRTDRLSHAYQRIRTATGLDDVGRIITKYQTRDTTVTTLQAQMKAARDRVDTLTAERRSLVWALDEAQTLGASATESRALYHSMEEYDRRNAEASRRVRESRDRLNRLSVVLEEGRACLVKMCDRVGIPSQHIRGVVAGTAGAPPPDSPGKLSSLAMREGEGGDALFPGAEGSGAEGAGVGASGDHANPLPAGGAGGDGPMGSVPPSPASWAGGRRRGSFGASGGASGSSGGGGGLEPHSPPAGPISPHVGGRRGSMGGASSSGVDGDAVGGGRSSSAAHAAAITTTADGRHVTVVQPDALEHALAQLEQRVSQLLAQLAAVFEREEAVYASTTKAKGGKGRRGGVGTAGGSVVGGVSRSAVAALETATTAVTESDAAAHRMSVAALSDKASMRVFQRLMTLPPDTSDKNVRINARAASPEPTMSVFTAASAMAAARSDAMLAATAGAGGAGGGGASTALLGGGGGGGGGTGEEVHTALHKSAADLAKLLHGSGAGSVVDRVSLKRLSAMVATSLGGSKRGGGAGGSRLVPTSTAGMGAHAAGAPGGGGGASALSGEGGTSPRSVTSP